MFSTSLISTDLRCKDLLIPSTSSVLKSMLHGKKNFTGIIDGQDYSMKAEVAEKFHQRAFP